MNRKLPTLITMLLVICGLVVVGCGEGNGGATEDSGIGGPPGSVADSTAAKRAEKRAEAAQARTRARKQARRARTRARRKARRQREKQRRRARAARARNGGGIAVTGDLNCGDFDNQAEAQRHLTPGDPHRLDGDGDGVACQSLPCPCSKAAGGGGAGSGSGSGARTPARFRGPVVSVTDGDTIVARAPGGAIEKIRIIGIDTPEVYGGVECGGREASAAMKRLAIGTVTVSTDPTQDRRDRYGRLLAYINKGSRDLGLVMVRRGLAAAYPYDGPFQRYPAYRKAERRAKAEKRGSWKRCDISPG